MFTLSNFSILVPTDFSDFATRALEYAKAIAKPLHATLHIVHVLEPAAYMPQWGMLSSAFEEIALKMQQQAGRDVEELAAAIQKEGLEAKGVVLGGTPHNEIVKYAADNDIQLIVIGTHGRRGLEHFFVGSTTERVIRLAQCPVLSVHADKTGATHVAQPAQHEDKVSENTHHRFTRLERKSTLASNY
jgi:nucleotide-binding universal stress UspA family protein